MLVPNRHASIGSYRYGLSGKEKDDEIKGEGNSLDYGARMLDPRVGRWFARDPLESKYPSLSGYNFVGNMPIRAVDPDGKDIYILFYTTGNGRGDEMFKAAALTRQNDIEKSKSFDPAKDKVVVLAVKDLASIDDQINSIVENYSPKYGQTQEFGIWSHASLEGPVGTENTSTDAVDGKQMSLEGWGKIDFNWKNDGNGTNAGFYGCRTGVDYTKREIVKDNSKKGKHYSFTVTSFSKEISSLPNFKNVGVSGQINYTFPSKFTNYRLNSEKGKDNFIDFQKDGSIIFQKTYLVGGKSNWYDLNQNEQNHAFPMQNNKNGETIDNSYQPGTKK